MAVPSNATYSNGSGVISGDQLDTFVQGGMLVANLRVFPGLSNMTVVTLGTSTAGDGGGGEFYWNSTSTATDDGVTVVRPYGLTVGAWLRVPQQISGGDVSNVAITGGTIVGSAISTGSINNTPIGNSIPSSGAFSTLSLSTVLSVADGGTGLATPGTAGNVLTSTGTAWASVAPTVASGVSSFNTRSGAVTLTTSDVTTAQPNTYKAVGTYALSPYNTTLFTGGTSYSGSSIGLAAGTWVCMGSVASGAFGGGGCCPAYTYYVNLFLRTV